MYSQIFFVLCEIVSELILFLINKEGINVASIVVTELVCDTRFHFYFTFHFSSAVIGIAHL